MTIRGEIESLKARVDELEDVVVMLNDKVEAATRFSRMISVLSIVATVIVGLLQAAATWYK